MHVELYEFSFKERKYMNSRLKYKLIEKGVNIETLISQIHTNNNFEYITSNSLNTQSLLKEKV